MSSSYRTTIFGALTVLMGLGVIAFGLYLAQPLLIPTGMGMVTAGAGLMAARDQQSHVEDAAKLRQEIKQETKAEIREELTQPPGRAC